MCREIVSLIEIPQERLAEEVLVAIIEEFISREGTDYGAVEQDFTTKVTRVKRQIEKGDVVIVFDPESESCNLLTKREFITLTTAR